jgi:predicted DNA-binding transcriptional regulator AlpA
VRFCESDAIRSSSLGSEPRPKRWLRVSSAAAYLGIGKSTLNKLRTYGGGPRYAKLGAVVVYDPADLDAWAAERKVRSTSEPVRAT